MGTHLKEICAALILSATLWAPYCHALTVRVGDYPPFVYEDDTGNWVGTELKVVRAVVEAAGLEYAATPLPWNRAVKWLEVGKLDVLYSLAKTARREEFIDFIGPSRYEQMCLIVRKEELGLEVSTLEDLKKLTGPIGIQDGVYYPNLTEALGRDPQLAGHFRAVHNDQLNAKMTGSGRLLGFVEDRFFAGYLMNNDPALGGLAIHPFCLTEPSPVYMGVSRKLPEGVRRKLHKAYAKLDKSGELKRLMDKSSR